MSANTLLSSQTWLGLRKAAAAVAGLVVSVTGVSGTVIAWGQHAEQAIADRLSPVNIVAAPAGDAQLSDHESGSTAARLGDRAVSQGLPPGHSAYFGYVISLARGEAAQVAVRSDAPASNARYLSYEVRSVPDATTCRSSWAAGKIIVAKRAVGVDASQAVPISRGSDLQLCIKVTLADGATAVHTEPLNWKFVAEPVG